MDPKLEKIKTLLTVLEKTSDKIDKAEIYMRIAEISLQASCKLHNFKYKGYKLVFG